MRYGYAVVDGEYLPGVVSVASGTTGPKLAICAVLPAGQRNRAWLVTAVQRVAAAASDQLGSMTP